MFAEGYFPFSYKTDDQEVMDDFIIKMRNLVYVSMTRAKNLLTLTYWGRGGSRFINEMNPSLYEWEGEPMVVNRKPQMIRKPIPIQVVSAPKSVQENGKLVDYLKGKGLEVIDKRGNGGALWVVGDKSIDPILKEARKQFGSLWTFSAKGGHDTKNRSGWLTKSLK